MSSSGQQTTSGVSSASTTTFTVTTPPIINSYEARIIALREVRDYTQHLSGRVKTIVDAAVVDPIQRKALKDLLHDAMWGSYEKVVTWTDRQIEVERRVGYRVYTWSEFDNHTLMHPVTDTFYVFPFSMSSPGPSAV